MQRYSHDYTKVSEAESLLYSAQKLMATGCYFSAREAISEARQHLQEYLASDNMNPDDDVVYGWYKAQEVEQNM